MEADPLERLFEETRRFLEERCTEHEPEVWGVFEGALARVRISTVNWVEVGPEPPTLRHLRRAADEGRAAAGSPAHALEATVERALWRPAYRPSPWSRAFNDGLAVLELCGPGGPIRSDDCCLGLMLCAPGLEYPRHAHPAAEVYAALSAGGAVELAADGNWRPLGAGGVSYHPPDTSHAFRTSMPVLIAYAWAGDVHAPTWWKVDMTNPSEQRRDTLRTT